jgi:outer membrane receptor for ferrienterochelin and colicins
LETIGMKEDVLVLERIVISASRAEESRQNTPILCSIVTEKIFDATQSLTLSEVLSFQPALRVENNCQNCGFNSLRMNGLEGGL